MILARGQWGGCIEYVCICVVIMWHKLHTYPAWSR
jgi:hypothetical protein